MVHIVCRMYGHALARRAPNAHRLDIARRTLLRRHAWRVLSAKGAARALRMLQAARQCAPGVTAVVACCAPRVRLRVRRAVRRGRARPPRAEDRLDRESLRARVGTRGYSRYYE